MSYITTLTDDEIVAGLRCCDNFITKNYFYPYCKMGWNLYNKEHDQALRGKDGFDYMTLAHEYWIKLALKEFKDLERRRNDVSLCTWMIGGYRYIILENLKAEQTMKRRLTFEERIANGEVKIDMTDDSVSREFRDAITDLCKTYYHSDPTAAQILTMILVEGYKGYEVAERLGITPAAVSQRYKKMLDSVVNPYLRDNLEIEQSSLIMPAANASTLFSSFDYNAEQAPMEDSHIAIHSRCNHLQLSASEEESQPYDSDEKLFNLKAEDASESSHGDSIMRLFSFFTGKKRKPQQRITPSFVSELCDNQVFVFGSNLAGCHIAGGSRIARERFGAKNGIAHGISGQSYAIPSMQGSIKSIKPYVDEFIIFAQNNPKKEFLVIEIGCGVAGFTPEEIAPLFSAAKNIKNISLPQSFWNILNG